MSYLNNPRKLAFLLTFLLLIIIIFIDVILLNFFENQVIIHVFSLVIVAVLFYVIILFSLEKFIYKKIKLIYKTIHSYKLGKNNKTAKEIAKGDYFENVNKEVEIWVQNKADEISNLKQMAQYRREFLGNVSHELKTPVFNIQGYIHTLLEGGLEDPTINREYLERSVKSIDRMIALISDLEKISALESGKLEIRFSKFALLDLIKDVIEFLEFKTRSKGIKVTISNQSSNSTLVMGDIEKIREVLINLIDNAVKYIGNPESPLIKISLFDMDENILVEVTDNGIGIHENDLPRVFERFFRADKARSRDQGGTGLGLSIVKHIIEAHEQTINVRSKCDIGTTFAFTLKKA